MAKRQEEALKDTFGPHISQLCHLVALTAEGKVSAALDSTIVTLFAENPGLELKTAGDVTQALRNQFGLQVDEQAVQPSLDRSISHGQLIRDGQSRTIRISEKRRQEVLGRVEDAQHLEETVRSEWFGQLARSDPEFKDSWKDELWACLTMYMARAFYRHGAETISILDPDSNPASEAKGHVAGFLDEAIRTTCLNVPRDRAVEYIRSFFTTTTPPRTRYLSQLLDATFTYFALTADRAISEYLRGSLPRLDLFVDTNFVFGVLGIQANEQITDVAQELLGIISAHEFPFRLYYHTATLDELERTIHGMGASLKGRTWTPAASRVAVKTGWLQGLALAYHRKNAEKSVSPEAFLLKYEHAEELLATLGFEPHNGLPRSPELDQERHLLWAEYKAFLVENRPWRPKKDEAITHDVALLQTVRHLRNPGRVGLRGGALLLTADFSLYSFERHHLGEGRASSAILPMQFIQILRPFIRTSEEENRGFVEAFAIPEFRALGDDYTRTASLALSYLNELAELNEDAAFRILSDQLLMQSLKEAQDDLDRFTALLNGAVDAEHRAVLQEREALKARADEAVRISAEKEAIAQLHEQERQRREQAESEQRVLREQVVQLGTVAASAKDETESLRREMSELKSSLQQSQSEESRRQDRRLQLYRACLVGAGIVAGTAMYQFSNRIALAFLEAGPAEALLALVLRWAGALIIAAPAFWALSQERLSQEYRTALNATVIVIALLQSKVLSRDVLSDLANAIEFAMLLAFLALGAKLLARGRDGSSDKTNQAPADGADSIH